MAHSYKNGSDCFGFWHALRSNKAK